ncbi:RidA family protein [Nonomuraea sp. NPDC049709]|uniref:RidA family protein n=1 Tax=Nonomuraea sp. NPDC049709 TaxID=3154736 RepID=UPI003422191E
MTGVRRLDPDGLVRIPGGLSHCVVVERAGLVFLSGQVAWDEAGRISGDDHGAQAERIAAAIGLALAAAGTGREHIVKETIYVVGYRPELLPGILAPLRQGVTSCPASTLVEVVSLAEPGLLVEVEVVAALP